MRNLQLLTLLLLVGVLLAATPAHAQSVQQLWSANCATCHGTQGEGANAQSLLLVEKMGPQHDRRQFEVIRDGLPDQGMPGFDETLSDEQMWGMVVHIRELQAQHLRKQSRPRRPGDDGVVETTHHRYRLERVIERGLSVPWSVTFLTGGRMLIAERPGTLRIYDGEELGAPVRDTPEVVAAGQGGMLDVAAHPDFADNGWIYLSYSHGNNGSMTRVVRGRIEDNQWTDQEVIFEAPPETYLGTRHHYGCRLVFDDEGYIYLTIGDRGRGPNAQDLAKPNGKVHRLHDDGRVPKDNPFVDEPGAIKSIWSYGHRNPQGMVYDPQADQLWATEHGPRGGDELNLIRRGQNYGWPIVSFAINYNGSPDFVPWHDGKFTDPIFHWTPSIAACGLDQVRGPAFPNWQGDLLTGGLAGQVVERLRIRDGEVVEREAIIERIGRVRDVVTAPDGTIYLVLNGPDHIVRLLPADQP